MDNALKIFNTKELLHDSDFYYIICTDNDGNYSYINNHYYKSFGGVNKEIVGQPYYITMHPDDRKICEDVGGKCYANPGKLFPATIRKHSGNGGYIVTQWEFTLIIENGEPAGVFCLGYDITEYVTAKAENRIINEDLENKKSLLEVIAYQHSHNVRAPLANIIGLVNILKNMDLDPNLYSIISMLQESSDRLDNVIKKNCGKHNFLMFGPIFLLKGIYLVVFADIIDNNLKKSVIFFGL